MIITRTSPFSGKVNELEIDITKEQLIAYEYGQASIQDVFPQLTADEREFIMTGITADEWKSTFGKEEDYYETE